MHFDDFECGHIIPYSQGGPTSLENLRPVCKGCNRSMGTTNMLDYKSHLKIFKRNTSNISD